MKTLREFQAYLKSTGRYHGELDGLWGRLSEAAFIQAFTDGPDTKLTPDDIRLSAQRNGVSFAQLNGLILTESSGPGFANGKPLILPERHWFWRNLSKVAYRNGKPVYGATPLRARAVELGLAYPNWGTKPYPKNQDAAYDLLLKMIRLDPQAACASASWGKFQIMGFHHSVCGYPTPFAFAEAMSRDEATQLLAFENFMKADKGKGFKLLRQCTSDPKTCEPFAAWYNGSGYRKNNYHMKLAKNINRSA